MGQLGGQVDGAMWSVPGGLPVLSRGRHRRPRHGACFMEFASYLAGEPWSDHPECTHPFLAFLARGVNDFTSDSGRQRLARHIPSVVGLTGTSPLLDPVIALRAAVTPLGVAAESAQRSLAAGVLACEKAFLDIGGAPPSATALIDEARRAAPMAMEWATDFAASVPVSRRPVSFSRRGRAIVSTSVLVAADALVDEPDVLLYEMLVRAIDDARGVIDASDVVDVSPQASPGRAAAPESSRARSLARR